MVSPQVSSLEQTGAQQGTVAVQVGGASSSTTVFEREELGSQTWWVTGSGTTNLRVDAPSP
jgi:hypothetical protein